MAFLKGRSVLLFLAAAVCLLLSGAPAPSQEAGKKPGGGKNKVLIYPGPGDSIDQLKQRGLKVRNYGSYWLAEATDDELAGLKGKLGVRAQKANHLNRIELAVSQVDTTVGEPKVPEQLKERPSEGKHLRLVQFVGPVVPEWLRQVSSVAGAKVITYVPNDAYLVYLDENAEKELSQLVEPKGPIQWIGKYHPHYKIHPALLESKSATAEISVSVFNGGESEQTLRAVESYALSGVHSRQAIGNQTKITFKVAVSDLTEIAHLAEVVWIEPVIGYVSMDEYQDLIVSGFNSSSRNGPTSPGYLSFLTGLGFSVFPEAYPVVDIADTGLDKPNPECSNPRTPFLPIFYVLGEASEVNAECCNLTETRVAYNTAGPDDENHGTYVAAILTGYDTFSNDFINCYIRDTRTQTNLMFSCVDFGGVTNAATTNDCRVPPASLNCIDCLVTTNTATVCAIVTNRTQNNIGMPYTLNHRLFGFQAGLGISPFGRFGASAQPPNGDAAGAVTEISAAYLASARISNNSWGQGLNIGVNDGQYNEVCVAYDSLVRDAVTTGTNNPPHESPVNQEMTIIFSGGDANGLGTAGGFGDVLVTPPATAKNVISVGATEGVIGPDFNTPERGFATDGDNANEIWQHSSFGPTRDGRFKPEIVAPGSFVLGPTSQAVATNVFCDGCDPNNPIPPTCSDPDDATEEVLETIAEFYGRNNFYNLRNGTSFSAPLVSGASQLLWWWFQNKLLMLQPSPAMTKAYILNSAQYLSITNPLTGTLDTLPSPAQGMGRLNLATMFDSGQRVLRDETTPRAIDTPLLTTNPVPQQTFFSQSGQSYELGGLVANSVLPFRVTLSWVDAPGVPLAFKELVNDLDLEVTVNGQTYKGNQFVGPNSVTGCPNPNRPCPDDINNTESVFIPAASTGGIGANFSIKVRAANIAGQAVPNVDSVVNQDFALVVYNANSPTDIGNPGTNDTCQTAITITNFPFAWTNGLNTATYTDVHPSPSAGTGGIEEFLKIPKPTVGTLFTVTSGGPGSLLSIWRGNCGTLVEVASSANAAPTINFTADGSSDYYIVVDGLNGGSATVQLLVTRTVPSAVVVPLNINFGDQAVGTTSTPRLVSINNSGATPLQINSIVLQGANPTDFLVPVTNACTGATILPGNSCNFNVSFAPTVVATRSAAIVIVTTDPTNPTNTVSLTGNGITNAPALDVNPTRLFFGDQAVNTTGAVQSVVVTNSGSSPLVITSVIFFPPSTTSFLILSNSCVGTSNAIPAGGICTIGVAFSPKTSGVFNASLRILSNAGSGLTDVPLNGNGVAPAMTLAPSPLNFGTQAVSIASAPQTVNVQSVGDSVLSNITFTVIGTNSGAFSVVNQCAGQTVPPGSSCGLVVTFTPTVLGSNTAQLVVSSTATNSPKVVNLTGFGANTAPTAIVTPTSLSFGNQPLNTTSSPPLSVTVSNSGNATLAINGASFNPPGEFFVTNNLCGSLPPGQTCTIGAVFRPTALGVRASTLQILSNAGNGTNTVAATGTGTAPGMSLQPNPLNFGTQAVSIASAPLTVNVQSIGDSVLTITNVVLSGVNTAAFTVVNQCAGGEVPPGSSCGLVVTFTPVVLGSNTAQLVVFGNATNSPQVVNLAGVGTNTAPTAIVTPASLTFGNQPLNTTSSPPLSVTVSNSGNAVLAINGASFSPPGEFFVTNNLCGSVPPGGTCTIGAVFRPTALGARISTLQILSNAGTGTNTVAVTGNGIAPVIGLDNTSVNFGTQAVSIASAPQTINVLSVGDAPLTITNVVVVGTNAADFAVTANTCLGSAVPPGSSCGVSLSFTPGALGVRTAQVQLWGNATNSPQIVNLSGVGTNTAPSISFNPLSLSFGNQPAGTTSTVQSITVSNAGNASLAITNLSFFLFNSGDFIVTNATCLGVPIAPGGTCTIGVVFTPSATGVRKTNLRVFSNSGGSPHIIPVTGNGTAPAMVLQPNPLNFSTQAVSIASAPLTVNVLSVGDSVLNVTNVAIIGTNAAAFAVSNACAGAAVPPGSSCGLVVTFTPVVLGSNTAQLVVFGTATNSPQVVNLNGVGANTAPTAIVTPTSLSFGNQPLGTTSTPPLSVTVSNSGNAVLAITNVVFSPAGEFLVTNNLCGSLAPGQTCTIGALFRPTTLGARSATLQIFNNSGVNPVTIVATGNGTAPAMVLQPNPLNFSTQAVSIASAPLTVNVLSVGDSVLSITNVAIIGTNAGAFSVVNQCAGQAVPPGSSCGLVVTFTPVVLGSNTAQLVVFGTATNSPQVVNLNGVGANTAPTAIVTPTSLSFGNQALGTTSTPPLSVTVSNSGNAVLAITNVVFSPAGEFLVTNNLCGSLAPGQTCTIGALFKPAALGARSATLQIFNNSGINPVTIAATGNGVAPAMVLQPNPLAFGTQAVSIASAPLTVNVLSVGDSVLNVTNVAIIGTNAAAFTVVNNCAGQAVPPGSSCGLTVTFTPVVLGSNTAQLVVFGTATNSPQTVNLTGVGANTAPTAIVTPTSLNFGSQPLGTTSSPPLSVTVSNSGNAVLAITNVVFSPAGEFLVTNNLCGSIAPGQTCTIGALFRPTALGARSATLQIFNNSGVNPVTVAATGNGTAPAIGLDSSSVNFGTQAVSIASAPQTINVLSVGDAPLTITNVVVVGTNAADFAVTANTCLGSAVPPGSSCGVSLTFTPGALGVRTAQVQLWGNATNSPQIVNLSGVGTNTAPSISFNPLSLSFGNQPVGTTSTVQSITVSNAGNASLAITNLNFFLFNSGDFIVTNATCLGVPIAPGGTCTIGVVFTPSATGVRKTNLRVFSNSGGSPHIIPVTGNGSAPAMVLQPNPLAFGTQAVSIVSAPLTVNVLSVGDSVLNVTNVAIVGTNAAAFAVSANGCGGIVPPGSSCGLSITFTPVVLGSNTAQLVVFGTATNSPQVVNLNGVGANTAPSIQVVPSSLSFGNQPLNTTSTVLSVTVSNNGNATLAVTNVVFSGGNVADFNVISNTCGSIPVGGSCTISAVFHPSAPGARSSTLQIFNNSGVNPATVPVTGNGVAPAMVLQPNPLAFGTQAVSIASAPLTVNVQSVGDSVLNVTNVQIIGTNAAAFTVVNNCAGQVVPPGSSCGLTVTFTPVVLGSNTAQLVVFGNATNSPQVVNLTGFGVVTAPTAIVAPTSLAFGNQPLNSTSAPPLSVTVSNSGNATLAINNVNFSGGNAGDFLVVSNACGSVAPGATCTIQVVFRPTALGVRTSSLQIFNNSGINPVTVAVSGNGVAPLMALSPNPLAFGTQAVSIASAPLTVNVQSVGDSVLSNVTFTVIGTNAGAFTVVNNCAGQVVPPGSSCGLTVTFTPTVLGSNTAQVVVFSTATNSPQTNNLTGFGVVTAPTAIVTPTSLSFGNQPLNSTSAPPLSVTVSNSGNATLAINNVNFSGGNAGDFLVVSNACGSVAPGGTCTIQVVFRPTALGVRTSSLQIFNNSGINPVTVAVSGNGVAPLMALSPNPLAFGTQAVSIASAPLTVNVQSVGDSVLSNVTFTVIGTNAGAFTVVNNCAGQVVPPGSSCGLTVTFTPTVLGSNTAQVVVFSTATNSPQTNNLTGFGVVTAPTAIVTPTSLSFGNQPLNSTSAPPLSVTVSNSGNATLAINNVNFSGGNAGDFLIVSNACGSVAPGGTCTIQVVFRPTALGVRTSSLQIFNNSGINPVTVAVSGNGVAPLMALSPNPLAFGTQAVSIASAPLTVNVQSVGDSVLSNVTFTVIGTNAGAFTVVNNCAGQVVPPGSSCGLTVTFTPTVLGSNTAQVVVFSTATNSPQTNNLTGFGVVTAPTAIVTPTSLSFGNQPLNSTSAPPLSVTVSNSGNATLAINNVNFSGGNAGDFLIVSNACGSVAPGGTCTIQVVFRPTALGVRTSSLQIFNNSGINPVTVAVSGNGVAPLMALSPNPLAFGTQAVSIASAPLTVNVQSVGDSVLSNVTFTVIGTNAGAFTVVNNCAGQVVPPGSSCGLTVTFTPTVLGSNTAQVVVFSTATNSPQTNNLTGFGVVTAPTAIVTPTSLSFGNQPLNSTSAPPLSVTVSNSGNATLAINNVNFSGGNAGDFLIVSNACGSVAPGGTCTIQVVFRPTALGVRTSSLQIFNNSGINPVTVAVSGNGVAPLMALSPNPLAFGTQAVSIASAPLTVNVQSVGDSVLSNVTFTVIGTNAGAFTVVNNCAGQVVPPGSSCGLTVTFTPTVLGSNTAQVVVFSTATNSPQTNNLTGFGVVTAPTAIVTPTSLSFGNQPLNSTSAPPLSVTVSNSGNATLAINNVNFSGGNAGDFLIVSNACGSVAPGGTCTIQVVFRPTALGVRTSSLQIFNNSGINPVTVAVSGNGVAPLMALSPNPLAFGTQAVSIASAPLTVNVQSVGDSVLSNVTFTVIGTNAGAFTVVNNCAGQVVPPGSSCGLTVTFTPTVLGSNTAQVVVFSTATNSPQTNNLTGFGVVTAPTAIVTPTSLSFGNQPLNSTSAPPLSVTVSNSGNATLAINNVNFSGGNAGDFLIVSNACGSVAPGGTCTIQVVFRPTALGVRTSSLQIFNNSGINPVTVAVSGNGVAPAMVLQPSSVNFGIQPVSIASAPVGVIVLSVGDSALSVTNVVIVGTNAADFVVATNTCAGNAIPPGSSCNLSIIFTPSALGARTAQLVVFGNATNSPQVVNLAGIGTNTAPSIGLTPSILELGDGIVGTTGSVQITLGVTTNQFNLVLISGFVVTATNSGTAPLIISGATLVGGNAGDFVILTNQCLGAGVVPTGTCFIKVGFAPTTNGVRNSTLRIFSNSGTGTNDVPVTGNGLTESFTVSPTNVVFGSQPVGIESAPQLVVVQNTGEAPVLIQGVAVLGANASDYGSSLGNCPNPQVNGSCLILPGQSTVVNVTFTPSALGTRAATLVLTELRFVNPPGLLPGDAPIPIPPGAFPPPFAGYDTFVIASVPLTGTGTNVAPSIAVIPPNLNFGDQPVGTTSAVSSITFTNSGNAALVVTNVDISAGNDFIVASFTNGVVLPGASGTINVQFTPGSTGVKNAFVRIWNNSSVNPALVPVSGNGTAPAIGAPNTVNFGTQAVNVASTPLTVVVTSVGDATLTITNFAIVGTNATDYTVTTNSCVGSLLGTGDSCGVGISFRPGGLGTRTAQLMIFGNATNSPKVVNLTGVGATNVAAVLVSPLSLAFSDQLVGTTSTVQSVTVSNAGTAALVISGVGFTGGDAGDFLVVSNGCSGGIVLPGANCVIAVASAPTQSGLLNTTLRILSNSGNGITDIPVSGSGVAPVMTLSTNALNFGSNTVNATSAPQTVLIVNSGNAPLTITNVTLGGVNPGDFFIVSNTCTNQILPNQSCQITLVFRTTTTLPRSALLTITGNAINSPQVVTLSGVGIPVVCGLITLSPSTLPNGATSTPYNQTITASGGTVPFTFLVTSGGLPNGLSLDSSTGLISGTPTVTGTFNFTVTATDVNGCSGSQSYTVIITCPAITLSPVTLPSGTTGIPYNQTITASNGAAPYSFAVTAGVLPTGLNLSSVGVLSGTPTNAGIFSITVTATDVAGCTGSRTYTLVIGCPGLTLLPLAFPNAVIGVPYTQTNSVVGGTPPYAFLLTSGSLPPGLNYSIDGVLFGTPSVVGSFNFTITATDVNNCTTSRAYTLVVGCGTMSLVPQTLPDATIDTAYSQTITVSGRTNGLTFAKTSGTLPPGLTLSSAGVLSGTPSLLGTFTFKVSALDLSTGCTGERFYTVKVKCPVFTISPPALPFGAVGTFYSQTFTASGGAAPYVFTQTSGSLPFGMALSSSGVLSGTPLSGSSIFTVTATDTNGCNTSATYTLVLANDCPPITVTPTSLPNATAGQAYNQTLVASGGVPPHTFAFYSGTLPPGLNLSPGGVLSGTPQMTGSVQFAVVALDGAGCAGFQSYDVNVGCDTITVNPVTLATGTVTLAYNQTLTATGGVAPWAFTVTTGTLPAGLTLDSSGSLTGTPTAGGNFAFTISATDAAGCIGSRLYSLPINPVADLAISKSDTPDPVALGSNTNITYTVTVTNRGPSNATGVIVTDVLPSDVSFVSATSGCTPSNNIVTCNLASLPSGTSIPFTIVVTPTNSGLLTNAVSVTSSVLDLTSQNDTNIAVTTVNPALLFNASTEIASASAGVAIVNVTRLGRTDQAVSVEYATSDGTAVAGTDYQATAGVLTFDIGVKQRSITVPLIKSSVTGHKTAKVNLHNPTGGAVLGARSSATIDIVNSAKPTPVVFNDIDGDTVTVKLTGAGAVQVSLDGDNVGPIDQIVLSNTDGKSSLNVTVKRGSAGNGQVDIASIVGAGSVKNINAKSANLTGAGINLGGSLGNLKINAVHGSVVSANAGIGVVNAKECSDSLITAGYAPASLADAMGGGTFIGGVQIKNFKATTFNNTTVAASQIGAVKLGTINVHNGGHAFGVLAQDSIGAVDVANPKFKWDPTGQTDQSNDDFHVKH